MDWDSLAAEGGNCCGCRSVLCASGIYLPVTVSTVRYATCYWMSTILSVFSTPVQSSENEV